MIANITKSGSNFHGAIKYNDDKTKEINKATGEAQAKLIDRHLVPNSDPKAAAQEFNDLSKYSDSTRKVMHISLNFHPDDAKKLDSKKMLEISQEYLKEMGYEQQPRLIYEHKDTAHPHIHIVTSRVNVETNRLIKDSHERRKSKRITEKLEQKYGLTIADKKQEKELSPAYQKSAAEVERAVKTAMRNSPKSVKELSNQMKKNGSDIRVKEVGKGIVYLRENAATGKTGKLRKGSDFKAVGVDKKGLDMQLSANKTTMVNLDNLLRTEQTTSLKGLEDKLKKYGVRPKYSLATDKENQTSIKGISFQYQGQNYKASSINKDLSWGKIKDNYSDVEAITAREQRMQPYRYLSENLKKSAYLGDKITLGYDGKRVTFSTPKNPEIAERLTELKDNSLALIIAERHNKGIATADKSASFKLDNYLDEKLNKTPAGASPKLELAERLKATVERGEYIGRRYENEKFVYSSKDKILEKAVNQMNDYKAHNLFNIVKEGIEKGNIKSASLKIDTALKPSRNNDRGIDR